MLTYIIGSHHTFFQLEDNGKFSIALGIFTLAFSLLLLWILIIEDPLLLGGRFDYRHSLYDGSLNVHFSFRIQDQVFRDIQCCCDHWKSSNDSLKTISVSVIHWWKGIGVATDGRQGTLVHITIVWKQLEEGPGEMFPWLRTCIGTAEDQHSVLIPHVRWLTTVNDSNPRAFSTSWPQKTICSQVHIPTQTHIPNKKKKN